MRIQKKECNICNRKRSQLKLSTLEYIYECSGCYGCIYCCESKDKECFQECNNHNKGENDCYSINEKTGLCSECEKESKDAEDEKNELRYDFR